MSVHCQRTGKFHCVPILQIDETAAYKSKTRLPSSSKLYTGYIELLKMVYGSQYD